MADDTLRVLLVEDDEDDVVLTRALLEEGMGSRVTLDWVSDYDVALERITRQEHDLYLVDYRLGERTGLDLMRAALRRGVRAPFIMQTGVGDHAIDLEAMRAGAADYLVKDELDGPTLERAIRYAVERERSAEALRRAHEELERRVAERTAELTAANERLAEADQRKDEFLATLAHELRNPLSPIRNAVHMLRRWDAADVSLDELTSMVERQVAHLTHLVDDLLDVSRITRGKIDLRKQRVDLAAVAAQTAETVRPLFDERRQRLALDVSPQPVWVDADPTRVEQVVTNLLTNACKYTPPGGNVRMTAGAEGGNAVVRVADDGI